MTEALLSHFVRACARGDFAALQTLLAPDVRFRYATPLEARQAQGWVEAEPALRALFPPDEKISEVVSIEVAPLGDRWKLSYRMRGHQPDFGAFVYEQHAYAKAAGERISDLRILCSGFLAPDSIG